MLRPRVLARPALLLRRPVQSRLVLPKVLARRTQTTTAIPAAITPQTTTTTPPATTPLEADEDKRQSASFFISNVLPIKLAYWDPRPAIARLREDALMEQLSDIGSEISGNGFRIESWEISRKDGGVFLHFSYIPPTDTEGQIKTGNDKEGEEINKDLSAINALPERSYAKPSSPGRLFMPQLVDSAKKHGGFPSWLGQQWANWTRGQSGDLGRVPGHELYAMRGTVGIGIDEVGGTIIKGSGSGMKGIQALAGDGRVWLVKGRQWTEVSYFEWS
jgi:hypothetical protein